MVGDLYGLVFTLTELLSCGEGLKAVTGCPIESFIACRPLKVDKMMEKMRGMPQGHPRLPAPDGLTFYLDLIY